MTGGLIFRSYNGKNATLYGKGAYFAKTGNYSYAAQQLYAKPHPDGTQRLILVGPRGRKDNRVFSVSKSAVQSVLSIYLGNADKSSWDSGLSP